MAAGAAVFLRALRSEPAPHPTRTKRDLNRRANSDEWIVDLVSLREGGGSALHRGRMDDPQDAPVGWVDVTRVRFSTIRYNGGGVQPGWSIQLAAKPPPRRVVNRDCASPMAWCWTDRRRGCRLRGRDRRQRAGTDLAVWVTDVATGKTEEHRPPVRLSDRVQSP